MLFLFRRIGATTNMVGGLQPTDSRVVVEQREVEGVSEATLIINPLKKSDDGLYTCIAVNKVICNELNKIAL